MIGSYNIDAVLSVNGVELAAACDLYIGRLQHNRKKTGDQFRTTPFAKYCTRMERNIASAAPYAMPEACDDRHGHRVNLKAGTRDLKRIFQDFVSGMRAAGPSLAVNHSYF
jgi:hypothetical protein